MPARCGKLRTRSGEAVGGHAQCTPRGTAQTVLPRSRRRLPPGALALRIGPLLAAGLRHRRRAARRRTVTVMKWINVVVVRDALSHRSRFPPVHDVVVFKGSRGWAGRRGGSRTVCNQSGLNWPAECPQYQHEVGLELFARAVRCDVALECATVLEQQPLHPFGAVRDDSVAVQMATCQACPPTV